MIHWTTGQTTQFGPSESAADSAWHWYYFVTDNTL